VSSLQLHPDQQAQLRTTLQLVAAQIEQAGGAIPFDRFMELALYAPGAGYYVNGSHKFGAEGDFITAPEVSPLFSQCLANQCAQVLGQLGGGEVLEFGAGSGIMAADMLLRLQHLESLPERYLILELSAELQQRQRQTIERAAPDLLPRVQWIDSLPSSKWRGVVVANEVLDAMPVNIFRLNGSDWQELYVAMSGGRLVEQWGEPGQLLRAALEDLRTRVGELQQGYRSEINLRLQGWLQALSGFIEKGAVILVDYGYTGAEYYHPERSEGTLICHLQHRAHDDPLALPGLQDITANVDFSAVAHAGLDAGLELAGYTTQAHFLIANGLDGLMSGIDLADTERHLQRVQELKQLTLPTEMGERFKVIGFERGLQQPLQGFQARDLRVYL